MDRKWLPTFAELVDRLSIHQLKEVLIPAQKTKYAEEMQDIAHDLSCMIRERKITLSSDLIRAIVVLSQLNAHIWYNESKARLGSDQDLQLLKLTHGINGLRNRTMNFILDIIGEKGRKDWKTDCLAAEFKDWDISLRI